MKFYSSFGTAIEHVQSDLQSAYKVENARWQSSDVSNKPDMQTRELFNTSFQVALDDQSLDWWREDIKPNLPWADDHFEERVAGVPLNPGVQWANWPYAHSANKFRTEGEKFSHTYMERYWPKQANGQPGSHIGIRYRYGDLNDVVEHLFNDPTTRQAFLPIWFPEDTGVFHGERVPCTLGYHFLWRQGFLHCTYYIRSCDFVRHFRDDLYLSLRLQLWILDKLRSRRSGDLTNQLWRNTKPGFFVFHCVSMHLFENDYRNLYGEERYAERQKI